MHQALALIPPAAVAAGCLPTLLADLLTHFTVSGLRMLTLTRWEAEQYYAPYRGQYGFAEVVSALTLGPSVVLLLDGIEDPICDLFAKLPQTHEGWLQVSECAGDALREIDLFFNRVHIAVRDPLAPTETRDLFVSWDQERVHLGVEGYDCVASGSMHNQGHVVYLDLKSGRPQVYIPQDYDGEEYLTVPLDALATPLQDLLAHAADVAPAVADLLDAWYSDAIGDEPDLGHSPVFDLFPHIDPDEFDPYGAMGRLEQDLSPADFAAGLHALGAKVGLHGPVPPGHPNDIWPPVS